MHGVSPIPAAAPRERTVTESVGSARVQELEFTVEPFVEGRPGPHVQAAVDAAVAAGADVDFGPFSSICRVEDERMPDVVAAVTRAAFAHGATHVALQVSAADA